MTIRKKFGKLHITALLLNSAVRGVLSSWYQKKPWSCKEIFFIRFKCYHLFVKVFDGYIKASKFTPFTSAGGHWRNIVIRIGSNDEILVMIVLHPRELTSEAVDEIRSDLVDFLVNKEGKECGIVSIYLKLYSLSTDKWVNFLFQIYFVMKTYSKIDWCIFSSAGIARNLKNHLKSYGVKTSLKI